MAGGVDLFDLHIGLRLQVMADDGMWYDAVVTEIFNTNKQSPVQVRFSGYGVDQEMWAGLDCLRRPQNRGKSGKGKDKQGAYDPADSSSSKGATIESLDAVKVGRDTQVNFEGTWFTAKVIEVNYQAAYARAPIKVRLQGWDGASRSDVWVSLGQLRTKVVRSAADAKQSLVVTEMLKSLEKGAKVQAKSKDLEWYAAEVVEVSLQRRDATAPVKVHYKGYDQLEDEWVSLDCLKSKPLKSLKATLAGFTPPQAHATEPATPLSAAGKAARKGLGKSAAAAPSQDAALAALARGAEVMVKHASGMWCNAQVLEVSWDRRWAQAPVRIHYAGYGADSDEWVGSDRVHHKAPKGAGKGAASASGDRAGKGASRKAAGAGKGAEAASGGGGGGSAAASGGSPAFRKQLAALQGVWSEMGHKRKNWIVEGSEARLAIGGVDNGRGRKYVLCEGEGGALNWGKIAQYILDSRFQQGSEKAAWYSGKSSSSKPVFTWTWFGATL